MRSDGSNASEVYNTAETPDGLLFAGWSPNGRQLYFWSPTIVAGGVPRPDGGDRQLSAILEHRRHEPQLLRLIPVDLALDAPG